MRIGFTGTREGLSDSQKAALRDYLIELKAVDDVFAAHHGMCVGADAQFHELVREILPKTLIVGHPSNIKNMQANMQVDILHDEEPPLARNRKIVNAVEHGIMIACPKERDEQLRSGTWSTWRYARATKKSRIKLILPMEGISDGSTAQTHPGVGV